MVDWDGLLLAPRERDLMFVAGEEWTRFLEGYGPAALDRTVLAYYRAARAADRRLEVS